MIEKGEINKRDSMNTNNHPPLSPLLPMQHRIFFLPQERSCVIVAFKGIRNFSFHHFFCHISYDLPVVSVGGNHSSW